MAAKNFWDPLLDDRSEPSPQCLLRVKKDIAEFLANPPSGIFISLDETDLTRIHALIVGPSGTPYEGGLFYFFIRFPSDYPMSPPRVRMMTTDAGRVEFNPNLYASGKVCLSILGTWEGPPWSPAQTLETVLLSVQSLLSEQPFDNEPLPSLAMKVVKFLGYANGYNDYIQHETIRVAVCDTVDACLSGTSRLPSLLREQVFKSFAELYSKYEEIVNGRLHLTGKQLRDRSGVRGVYQYEALLQRLKDLNQKVEMNKAMENSGND